MTLNYSAKITVDAKDKTTAIYDSVNTDNEFYPENPVKTKIKLDKKYPFNPALTKLKPIADSTIVMGIFFLLVLILNGYIKVLLK